MRFYIFFSLLLSLIMKLTAATPPPALDQYLQMLSAEAKTKNSSFSGFDAKKGKEIFFQKMNYGNEQIACTTCHSINLQKQGLNTKTNKPIDPLAPSINKTRLTDIKEMQKWLKRNFKDVYKREGTAEEKGNVLLYISQQ